MKERGGVGENEKNIISNIFWIIFHFTFWNWKMNLLKPFSNSTII
jgi:hypothetical protein